MKKIFFLIIGLIVITGIYLMADKNQSKKDIYDIENVIKDAIEENERLKKDFFDSFFNDKFFSKDYDPFQEIERFEKKMMSIISDDKREDFLKTFREWKNDRISFNDIKTKQYDINNETIVEIETDNHPELNVEVRPEYIKVSSNRKDINEKKNEGEIVRTQTNLSFVKYIPLPENLRGKEYRIEKKDNKILIRFIKK